MKINPTRFGQKKLKYTDAAAFLVKAKKSKPRLDAIVNRVKAYDEAGNTFLNNMKKCTTPEAARLYINSSQIGKEVNVTGYSTEESGLFITNKRIMIRFAKRDMDGVNIHHCWEIL